MEQEIKKTDKEMYLDGLNTFVNEIRLQIEEIDAENTHFERLISVYSQRLILNKESMKIAEDRLKRAQEQIIKEI